MATLISRINQWLGWRSADPLPPSPSNETDEPNHFGRAVIAGIPDPLVIVDHEGRVIAFNAQANAIAPVLRRGELASIALRTPELVDAIGRTREDGEPRRVKFTSITPSMRWMEGHVASVTIDGPTSRRVVVITIHDITSVQRAEMMRADFVANASHELRTPLAALTGFIETLQGPARDDPAARDRFLKIMHQQAWRMARLIDDLLSLSRVEQREHLHPETPLDLVPVVRQVVDGLQTLARDRDVAINASAPGDPLIVLGDRDELLRVFENLIENALKYGASGKRVDVNISTDFSAHGLQEAQVVVRDYGPGISAEHRPRLTERFYRVDVGESRAQGGTGLGLALVKHIMNRHRGRLVIDSNAGQGAVFTVRLPLV